MLIQRALALATKLLTDAGNDNARSESLWMLAQLLDCSPTALSRHGEDELPPDIQAKLDKMICRRQDGEPLQYILGNVDFFSVNLLVGPGVLIPRPETEELVELALTLKPHPKAILDLCTGSGAIALSLAHEIHDANVTASDIDELALNWAQKNARRLHTQNITLLQGDLFEPIPAGARFDLITANPPYVNPDDYDALDPVVRLHEPKIALVAPHRGLAILERIFAQAADFLAPDGCVICEIGDEQGQELREIIHQYNFTNCEIRQDLAGKDRFAVAFL